MTTLELVHGTIDRVNAKGFRLQGEADWRNYSRYADPADILPPSIGAVVAVSVDSQGFVRAAQVGISRRSVFRLSKAATPKQSEVQRLRARGLTTREIAQRIGRSERQVRRLIGVRQLPSAEEVRQLRAEGKTVREVMTLTGISRRQVFRLSKSAPD
jgi:predicted DNA-binding transcriptional regulator AlpA